MSVVDSGLVKGILDLAAGFLQLANTDIGNVITQFTLLSGVLSGIAGMAIKGFGLDKAFGLSLGSVLPYILAVTGAIVALNAVIEVTKKTLEEKAKAKIFDNVAKSIEETEQKIEEYDEKIKSSKERLEELNKISFGDRTQEIEEESEGIQNLIKDYQDYISMYDNKILETETRLKELNKIPFARRTPEINAEISRLEDLLNQNKLLKDEYIGKVEDAQQKLQELNSIPFSDRSPEISAEIAQLEALIAAYEKLKQEEEDRKNKSLEDLENTEFTEYTTALDKGFLHAGDFEYQIERSAEVVDALSKSYGNLDEAVWSVAKAMASSDKRYAELIINGATVDDLIKELGKDYIFFQNNVHDFATELAINSQQMLDYYAKLKDSDEPSQALIDTIQGLINKNKEYYDILSLYDYDLLTQDQIEYIGTYRSLVAELGKAQFGAESFQEAIGKIQFAQQYGASTLEDYINILKGIEGVNTGNISQMLDYLTELGVINLDYTQEELQDLLDKISGIEKTDIDIESDVDTEEAEIDIETISQGIDELNEKGITVTSSSDADALIEGLNTIKTLIGEINALTVKITVNTNSKDAISELNSIKTTANNLPSKKDITVTVTDNAYTTLKKIADKLSEIKNTRIIITAREEKLSDGTGPHGEQQKATGTKYFGGGNVLINDGAPVNGNAGELVVADGQARIYNEGKPVVVELPRGAQIYTAAETQEILKNVKALRDGIPAFAEGNVTKPSAVNSKNIKYTPSSYYKANTPKIGKTEEDFEKWLKQRKHLLELDQITEEQYYLDLEKMNETYLKNNKDAQDKYWKYQEEVYKWKKEQLEKENELLEKQIELEKALGELAKVKTQKILVFKDGHFQYMADVDAIAEAQRNVNKIKTGYAGGTTSATAGMHLVGENGPELRVLNSGDGIIPSDLTKNLMEIAKTGINGIGNALDKTKEVLYSFTIGNITLPNVSTPEDFLNGLKNYAYQYSYS